jgi:hypothetical protein
MYIHCGKGNCSRIRYELDMEFPSWFLRASYCSKARLPFSFRGFYILMSISIARIGPLILLIFFGMLIVSFTALWLDNLR